jgi:hypothetical protein
MTTNEKIIDFLIKNDYKEDSEKGSEYRSFYKSDLYSIDVGNKEIVFISENGDFLHIPINYYALIGVLIHYRQIAIAYKF